MAHENQAIRQTAPEMGCMAIAIVPKNRRGPFPNLCHLCNLWIDSPFAARRETALQPDALARGEVGRQLELHNLLRAWQANLNLLGSAVIRVARHHQHQLAIGTEFHTHQRLFVPVAVTGVTLITGSPLLAGAGIYLRHLPFGLGFDDVSILAGLPHPQHMVVIEPEIAEVVSGTDFFSIHLMWAANRPAFRAEIAHIGGVLAVVAAHFPAVGAVHAGMAEQRHRPPVEPSPPISECVVIHMAYKLRSGDARR